MMNRYIFQRATQRARILLTDNIQSGGSCSVNYYQLIYMLLPCNVNWVDITILQRNITTKRRLIKIRENIVQARTPNEPVDFLVSSLNYLGSRQQVNDRKKYKGKQANKEELIYTCCAISTKKNYFICCFDGR